VLYFLDVKIICVTHADFETPGVIVDWARSRGHGMSIVRPYGGESLDGTEGSDFLIVMGGPQDLAGGGRLPYLEHEIEHIRKRVLDKRPVLGFCLGAQLIGESLGARAERSPEREIGVYPVELTGAAKTDPLLRDWPPRFDAIHWHGDMPGLTKEAVVLAKSEGCPRQIVRYREGLYALQCHLEITREGVKPMIDASPEDFRPGKFVQSKEDMLKNDYAPINRRMFDFLDRLAAILNPQSLAR